MKINSRHSLKKALVTGFLATLAVAAFLGSGVLIFSPPAFLTAKVGEEQAVRNELHDRRIIDFYEAGGGTIVYSYRGEQILGKLADDENIKKRTPNSYTRDLGINERGEPTHATVFYARDTFFKGDDGWYFVEYDEVSSDIFFREYSHSGIMSWVSRLLIKKIYAADFFSGDGDGDGDGQISASDSDSTASVAWNTARNAATGSVSASTSPLTVGARTGIIILEPELPNIYTATIYRMFLPFDTSSIPSGSAISSASLNIYVTSVSNDDPDANATLEIIQTSQSTHATLESADYNNVGTTEGATGISLGLLSVNQYNTFTLNSSGLEWIAISGDASNCSSTTGITCIGLREGHDLNNSSMNFPSSGNYFNTVGVSQSEATGTTQDPYLSVTYSSFASWQFFPF